MKRKESKSLDLLLIESYDTIPERHIDYFEENPEKLDLIVDKETIHKRHLNFFGAVSLILIVGVRTLNYFFGEQWGDFVGNVVLDVISEFGIALLGGVVTVYFLEVLQKKQYEENILYREEVLRRIEERKKGQDKPAG